MNRVQHFLIPADDMERAQEFYRELFGWDITPTGELHKTYLHAKTVSDSAPPDPASLQGIDGGFLPRGVCGLNDVTVVMEVDSIEPYLDKAAERGCRVVLPKTSVSPEGYFAGITDSEGNTIALWERKLAGGEES